MSTQNRPHPAIGSPVLPDAVTAADGNPVALADFAPRPVVLFTFGKAGTPSCDNAIADFDALLPGFTALGIAVLGLSKDKPAALARYLAKTGHRVALASDTGGLMEAMGAFGDKIFMGKPVRGVLRSSFLIDGGSRIAATWTVERVKGHAQDVLDHLRAMPR